METNDGRIICSRCKGSGRVPMPVPLQKISYYCGPNGETSPHEDCKLCNGTGWMKK